jgi:predicted AAA+ superfamily ATPase
VAAHLVNYLKASTGLLNPRISYWKEKYEVDFVIGPGRSPVPIEVKFASTIRRDDFPGLISFMENQQIQSGIVITKDQADVWNVNGMEILLIPAWLVLCSL